MAKEVILITGANGAIGHGLIPQLVKAKKQAVIALDIKEIDETLKTYVHEMVVADITDRNVIETTLSEHKISTVYHLAAILSTGGEKYPEKSHSVNVGGTAALLEEVNKVSQKEKRVIKFIFPSTIAVYG